MHETAQKIIELFKKTNSELSTSEILEKIDKRYSEIIRNIEKQPELKREKAKLHRKILHHLNKLTELNLLTLTKHGEKGEKFFSLNLSDNEEIIEISPNYKKRIIISKPTNISLPIEGYEQRGIVKKYEPATWIDRLNSVVIFCENIENLKTLYNNLIENIFSVINDAIDLENFEYLINKENPTEFLDNIKKECEDYGKHLNFTIEISKIKNKENFFSFLEYITKHNQQNFTVIFSCFPEEIDENSKLFIKIIDAYSKNKRILYIKNKKLQKSPAFIGISGPYSFLDKEWQFIEDLKKDVKCLACSQSSVIVDVNKFYQSYGLNTEKFSQLIMNISKSIFTANSIQRRKSGEYFRTLKILNKSHETDFLSLARNYIRFWNFGLTQPNIKQDFVFNMISEVKKKIEKFTSAEETIYKSCGMATRFRIALSCAFISEGLSPAKYLHLPIKNLDDFYRKELKKELLNREIINELFDGGNEVTFYYRGIIDPEGISRQIKTILFNFKIPLFNYNFKKISGDLKLLSFFKNGNNS